MRTNGGRLSRAFYSKEVSHHHLHVAETQTQVETQMLVGTGNTEKKGTKWALIGGCWHRDAGGLGIFCDRFGVDIWLPVVGPEMEVGDEN